MKGDGERRVSEGFCGELVTQPFYMFFVESESW